MRTIVLMDIIVFGRRLVKRIMGLMENEIVLVPKDGAAGNYYGANIGGWASSQSDSSFVLTVV